MTQFTTCAHTIYAQLLTETWFLAGILAVVVYKTRTEGETIRDPAEKNACDIRHQEAFADEYAAKAHAAQVEVDAKNGPGAPPATASGRRGN